jgi:hypothetical protein
MISGIQLRFDGNAKFLEQTAANAPKSMLLRETLQNSFEANATHVFVDQMDLNSDFVPCGPAFSPGVCSGRKMSILDNGHGMTGEQLQENMSNLFSSGRGKKFVADGGNNFGIGLRAMGAFHNPYGLIVESWVGGYGHRVIVRKNARTGQYELMPNGATDSSVLEEGIAIPKELLKLAKKQERCDDLISGTRVIFMGKSAIEDTLFELQVSKDMNKRFFRFLRPDLQVLVKRTDDQGRRSIPSALKLLQGGTDYGTKMYGCAFGKVVVHYAMRQDSEGQRLGEQSRIHAGVRTVWNNEIYANTTALEMYRALGIVLDPKAWAIYFELPTDAFTSKMDRASIVHVKDQQPFDPYEELCELIRNDLPAAIKAHQEKLAAAEDVMPKLDDWIKAEISKYIGLNSKMTHHIAGSEQMDITEAGDMSCSTIDEESTGSGKGSPRLGDGGGGASNTDHKNTNCSVGTKKKAMTVADALPEVVWASFLETKQESDEPSPAGSYNNEHGPRGKLTINIDFPLYKTLLRKLKDDYKLYSVSENVLADTLKRYWSLNLCVYIATVKLTFHKQGFRNDFINWVTDQALTIQGRGGCAAYNSAKISLDGKKNSWLAKEKITRAAMAASI